MIPELKQLTSEELEKMYTAPLWVSILIAGADGKMDKEIRSSLMIAEKKSRTASPALAALYKEVIRDFEDKLMVLIRQYPSEPSQRNSLIVKDLSGLNVILQKLDKQIAIEFYHSLIALAETIAKASGGFLGLNKVDEEEKKYLTLPMLHNPSTL